MTNSVAQIQDTAGCVRSPTGYMIGSPVLQRNKTASLTERMWLERSTVLIESKTPDRHLVSFLEYLQQQIDHGRIYGPTSRIQAVEGEEFTIAPNIFKDFVTAR